MGEFRIDGLRELQATLKKLPDNVQNKALRKATFSGAAIIRKEAKASAPVGTRRHRLGVRKGGNTVYVSPGFLKKNIIVRRNRKTKYWESYDIGVRRAFYWIFYEFGTSKTAARPFLRPALTTKGPAAIEKMAKVIKAQIEKFLFSQNVGRALRK